jgi:hypothetical protein
MDNSQQVVTLLRSDSSVAELLSSLVHNDALVRTVAGIQLANRFPDQLPESSIRELLDTLARLEYFDELAVAAEYGDITATELDDFHDLGQDIVLAFQSLRSGQADFAIYRLLEFWSFDEQFYELAHAMLALAFPLTDSCPEPSSLSGLQKRILQALVKTEPIWRSDMSFGDTLVSHGLPESRQDMRQYLGYRSG